MPVFGIICITVLIILSLFVVGCVVFCMLPLFNLDQAGREYRAERKKAADMGYRSGKMPTAQLLGGCAHSNAVPVELLDGGERVATLCPACDAQLSADFEPRGAGYRRNFFANSIAASEVEYLEGVLKDRAALEAMFSTQAVNSGQTKQFLEAYARNYKGTTT